MAVPLCLPSFRFPPPPPKVREVLLPHNESTAYIWQGACSILVCLAIFYKYLKRLVRHFLEWELVQVKKCQGHFFDDMTEMDLVDTAASAHFIPFCFHCYVCSKSQALGALVHAASLSHDLCHGNVPRAKTSELKLLTVNPQFTLSQAFHLMLGAIHLLVPWNFGKVETSETWKTMIMIWADLIWSRTFT